MASEAGPEVAVFGEWDTGNLGDRAIHVEAVRFFRECGWRTRSYSLGSLMPARLETVAGPRRPSASGLRDAALNRVPGVKRALRAVRQRYRMRQLLPELAHAHAISVGGGALLSDVNQHFPQSLAMLTEAARLLDKPLLCLGCSIEGSWSAQGGKSVSEFLAACRIVAARDNVTAERIAGVLCRPIPVFGDFCLTEDDARHDAHSHRLRRGIALNVCEVAAPWRAEQQRYEDALVALAARLGRRAGARPVRVFTTGTADDTGPAQRVFSRIGGGAELHLPRNLDELTAVLRGSAITVASRLHAAILAISEEAPVVGLSPTPKLKNYLGTMKLAEYCFTPEQSDRLASILESGDPGAILAGQRDALRLAPSWVARMQVRKALASLASARFPAALACT